MANVQITQLPAALPLDGTELVPVVQGGVTVRTTTAAVAGSPSQQQTFITVNQEPTLPNSRYLTANPGISVSDGGAQSTINLALTGAAASLNTASPGVMVKTDGDTVVNRSIVASGVGLSVSNGSGVSGNPTISLSGQIVNFASAAANGLVTLTSGGAVSATYIQGVSGQTVVTNGDGISGAPTIGLGVTSVTPGTYGSVTNIPVVTVDAYGRLTSVSLAPIAAGGTVTQINTGTGLTGGPITTSGTISVDTTVVATTTNSLTLTNKTISGATNTLSNIGNSSLTNSSVTYNGVTVSLGGSGTISAVSPYALTIGTGLSGGSYDGSAAVTIAIDSSVVTLTGSQTLTNKSMSGSTNTFTNIPNSALTNSSITIGSTSVSLGGTLATLTGASISGSTNTLSNIGNSSLTNSSLSVNGVSISLGGSGTVTAVNPYALTIGTGLSGTSYDGAGAVTIAISNTGVTAASYGGASKTLTATVNAQGQLTSLAETSIAISYTQVSGLGTAATLNAGVANGVATLDSGGQVPLSQLPTAIQGALNYQGSWNASTNTPTLTSGVGTKGYFYIVSVAGTTNLNGITDWQVGDWAVFNGTVWQKIDNTDAVSSVNGYTGAVVLGYADVGAPSTSGTNATGTWGISISGNAGTVTNGLYSTGSYADPTWLTSLAASKLTGTVAVANGGTNLSSYTVGDMLWASGATTLSKLGIGANTYVMTSSGSAPQWSAPSSITGVGSLANALTIGTHLTGTSYNGSSAVTIGTDATNLNTASTIVARDASGNFNAGIISAALNGNASSASNATNTSVFVDSTNATNYLTFVSATTGSLPQLVNSAITCNPSTGKITGGIAGGSF